MEQDRFHGIEASVQGSVEWLRLLVETLGAVVIAIGIVGVVVGLLRHALHRPASSFTQIRLSFARYLVLALELQLAADILSTAVAPTWEGIGKLAAIALIRTALNYFLMLEMRQEHALLEGGGARGPTSAPAPSGGPPAGARGGSGDVG
jgi:uncharacterized membrane protein